MERGERTGRKKNGRTRERSITVMEKEQSPCLLNVLIHCRRILLIRTSFVIHLIDDPHLPMRKEHPETRFRRKRRKEAGGGSSRWLSLTGISSENVCVCESEEIFGRQCFSLRISYDRLYVLDVKYLSLLGLLLVELTALGNAGKDLLTVLVELKGGDDDLGGGDAEGNGLAVGFLTGDAVDVDDPLETVDSCDLALAALVGATDNGDLIVLADGDRADLNDTFISIIAKTADRRALFCVCMCMGLLRETKASDGRLCGSSSRTVGSRGRGSKSRSAQSVGSVVGERGVACGRRCSHATGVGGGSSRGLICCAMFLSMPPSLSCGCGKMRRRRIGSGGAYVVLLTELLGERGAHDSAADTGRGREVRLARLSSGRRQSYGGRGSV